MDLHFVVHLGVLSWMDLYSVDPFSLQNHLSAPSPEMSKGMKKASCWNLKSYWGQNWWCSRSWLSGERFHTRTFTSSKKWSITQRFRPMLGVLDILWLVIWKNPGGKQNFRRLFKSGKGWHRRGQQLRHHLIVLNNEGENSLVGSESAVTAHQSIGATSNLAVAGYQRHEPGQVDPIETLRNTTGHDSMR